VLTKLLTKTHLPARAEEGSSEAYGFYSLKDAALANAMLNGTLARRNEAQEVSPRSHRGVKTPEESEGLLIARIVLFGDFLPAEILDSP
jgi:hypothetical protein